jgi:hypothetical protein
MNKLLYIILVISILLFLSIGGFYLYTTSSLPFLLKNNSSVSQSGLAWQDAITEIRSNCKVNIFPNLNPPTDYKINLLKVMKSGVIYDPNTKEVQLPTDKSLMVEQVNPCFFIWVGDSSGSGKVGYETKSGEIKTLAVKGFPLTTPLPVPSSTPIPVK